MANITIEGVQSTRESLEKKSSTQFNSGYNEKNYLDVRLKKGEEKKELRIRLLPIDAESSTPFKIVHMHNVKVPTEINASGWKNYMCLGKHNDIDHEKFGDKCPFCELRSQAYNNSIAEGITETEKKAWQKISLDNKPKDVCIVRCIERGHEDEGPKFWKIPLRESKKDDAYHAMIELLDLRNRESQEEGSGEYNIFDLYNGKDLKLTITAIVENGVWTNKTNISVVDYGKEKPLSEDEEEMNRWINDPKKWSDVFVTKPYEYLAVILDGKVPFFDKKTNKWVSKDEYFGTTDPEKAEKAEKINEQISQAINNATAAETSEDNGNDLPF